MKFFLKIFFTISGFFCVEVLDVKNSLASSPKSVSKKVDNVSSDKLMFPIEAHSYEAPDIGIGAVFRSNANIWLAVQDRSHFILVPFKGLSAKRTDNFGNLLAAKRVQMESKISPSIWSGIALSSFQRLLLLDGFGLRILSFTTEEQSKQMSLRSLAWDRIKPARDRRGEPTKFETQKLRASFSSQMKRSPDLKLTGLVSMDANSNQFFVASRIQGFPLLQLSCDPKEVDGSCWLDRACFLPRKPYLDSDSISGVAYNPKSKKLLLGSRKKNSILVYKANSCYDILFEREFYLPDQLRKMSGLHIDEENNLWVSTESPDDYLNASLYVWKSW